MQIPRRARFLHWPTARSADRRPQGGSMPRPPADSERRSRTFRPAGLLGAAAASAPNFGSLSISAT
eukprot:9218505-Alexandrium_andersonii.AAC.1